MFFHIYLAICTSVTRFLCDKGVKKVPWSLKAIILWILLIFQHLKETRNSVTPLNCFYNDIFLQVDLQ